VVLLALSLWLAVLAGGAGSALAQTGHKFLSQITTGPLGGKLNSPEAVAVDKSGNVFVGEHTAEPAVDVYNAAGELKASFGAGLLEEVSGVAVDAAGKVYVADGGANKVYVFKPDGLGGYTLVSTWTGANTPEAEFGEVAGIAVDTTPEGKGDLRAGDVYVVDRRDETVWIFKPGAEAAEGSFVSNLLGHPAFSEPSAIAVAPGTGQVYVSTTANEKLELQVFSNAGKSVGHIVATKTPTKAFQSIAGVAVEEATGDVYVSDAEGKAVNEFSEAGEWLGWLTAAEPKGVLTHFASPSGVAVAHGGDVYVGDSGANLVDVFGPAVTVPTVATAKATKVGRTAATFNGSIKTEGQPSKYYFEYSELRAGVPIRTGLTTPVNTAIEGESKVSAEVTGLTAGNEYPYRLVVTSANGATEGAVQALETSPAVSGVTTGPAENITANGATITGELKPDGIATKYRFEYGETTSFGKASPVAFEETSASGTVAAKTTLTGLKPDTKYFYRLEAFNAFGTTLGIEESFFTIGPKITPEATVPLTHKSVEVHALVNPNMTGKIKYEVEYGETTTYGTKTEPKEFEGEKKLEEEIKGLKLATTYHFRVVVTTGSGTFDGPDQVFTTPLIESEAADEVQAEKATLLARLNNLKVKEAAKYRFEYGESTSYGKSVEGELPPFEGEGTEKEPAVATAHLTGLRPKTTYHYRVVVTVSEGVGTGPDETFTTTEPAKFQLPDGRAYEMVTSPSKGTAFIEGLSEGGGVVQTSTNGDAFAYIVDGALEHPEGNRSFEAQQALAIRGSSGWSNRELVTPNVRAAGAGLGNRPEYEQFSPDLALSAVEPFPLGLTAMAEPPLSSPATEAERGHQEKTIYFRDNAPLEPSGSESALFGEAKAQGEKFSAEGHSLPPEVGYLPLVTDANTNGTPFGGTPASPVELSFNSGLQFAVATADFSHALLYSSPFIATEGPKEEHGLYEWSGGKLSLVSLLPASEGTVPAPGAKIELGAGIPEETPTNLRHAQSADGSRVFWTADSKGSGLGPLYLRDTVKKQTVRVDLPEPGVPQPSEGEARFQLASETGSRVFFTDRQRLTTDSTAREANESPTAQADLYVCQVGEEAGKPTCSLKDLSVDSNPGESANVQGDVLGASENGSSVYFVATGVLATGATPGADNLYLAQTVGGNWTTRFIATLSHEDSPDWGVIGGQFIGQAANVSARVSPHGQYLAFMSSKRLTGFNNTDAIEVAGEGETAKQHADEEVFLYNSANGGTLSCPSCNPAGARPHGVFDTRESGEGAGLLVDRPETWTSKRTGVDHWLAGSLPGWTRITQKETLYQSSYLNDEGRLYFMSADPLTPASAEERRKETIGAAPQEVGLENVYQYEPKGLGSCTSASGCVSQLSQGTSGRESAFLDATESGNDVFLITADKLLPQDTDTALDIYGARVCSEASPCIVPPGGTTASCGSTAECHPGEFSPPSNQVPASASFTGPGNTIHAVSNGEVLNNKVVGKAKPLTNAQKLAAAIKACKTKYKKNKKKRQACEKAAHKKYSAHKATKAHRGKR